MERNTMEEEKTRKSKTKSHAILPALPTVCRSTIHHLPSLDHIGIKWKITSITLIMPAFLCHRVWAQMPYVISWTSHWLGVGFGHSLDLVRCVHLHPASLSDVLLVWAVLLSLLCSVWKLKYHQAFKSLHILERHECLNMLRCTSRQLQLEIRFLFNTFLVGNAESMNSHSSTKKNSEVQLLQVCLHLWLSTDWKLPQDQGFCCMVWDVPRDVCREDASSVCFVSQGRVQCPAEGKNQTESCKVHLSIKRYFSF